MIIKWTGTRIRKAFMDSLTLPSGRRLSVFEGIWSIVFVIAELVFLAAALACVGGEIPPVTKYLFTASLCVFIPTVIALMAMTIIQIFKERIRKSH